VVKVFALLPQRPDITQEHFHEHWGGTHAELAKRIKTIRQYVQSHRIDPGVSGLAQAPYEGIAEVLFDDLATAAGMGEDPDYVEGCHQDEPNIFDMDGLAFLMTSIVVPRPGPELPQEDRGTKAILLLRRAQGAGAEEFGERLRGAAERIAEAVPDARRVSVAVSLPEMYADGAEPTYDAVVELSFTDPGAFDAATGGSAEAVLRELGDAIDPDASASFLAEELRVTWPPALAAVA
jgi:uncharacterized protein (TIGR02118 family)